MIESRTVVGWDLCTSYIAIFLTYLVAPIIILFIIKRYEGDFSSVSIDGGIVHRWFFVAKKRITVSKNQLRWEYEKFRRCEIITWVFITQVRFVSPMLTLKINRYIKLRFKKISDTFFSSIAFKHQRKRRKCKTSDFLNWDLTSCAIHNFAATYNNSRFLTFLNL